MKKTLSILLVSLMLLTTVIPVLSSNDADVVISGGEYSAYPGDYIEIPIVIEKNSGFCGLNIYFTYSDSISYDSFTNSVSSLTCTNGKTVLWDAADDYTGTGELAVLKVYVDPAAIQGSKQSVKINLIEAYDIDLNDVSVSTSDITINVISCSHNDTITTEATPVSCTEDGYSAGVFCNVCKKYIDGHERIESRGRHLWSSWIAGNSEKVRICSACSYTEREEIVTNPFSDVKDGRWYTSGIIYCYHNGYMAGTSNTVFGYKETVTRAMFVTILAQIDEADLSSFTDAPFSDVTKGKWYTAAIAWAAENEYASGIGEGLFGYKNPVTREQIALFFYTYSSKNGIDVSAKANLSGYADLNKVHSWALDALEWAVAKGLISGTSETTLSPRDSATRSEIPLIVMNYVENIKHPAKNMPDAEMTYSILDIDGLYKTQGRTIMYDLGLAMLSSADIFEFNAYCEGSVSINIVAQTTEDSGDTDVFYTGYVDGERCETRYHIDEDGKHEIVLAEDLPAGKHSFKIVRQTEWNYGNIYVTGVTFKGFFVNPPANKDIYIEFVGDSLTTGFGNLENTVSGSVWGGEPIYHDATQAYPYMTADALDADLSVVAIQGIGARCSRQPFTMNEIYNMYPRVNEEDYTYDEERSADIVVINMLANDGEIRSEEKVPPKEIVEKAKELCEIVRAQHPDALIVFAPAFFHNQVSEMIETELGGAANGYYVTKIPLDTAGLAGHPSVEGHEKGAEVLIEYLEDLMKATGLR